jgi:hypothetical protein
MVASVVVAFLALATVQADEDGITIKAKVGGVSEVKAGAGVGSIEVVGAKGPIILIVTPKTKLEKLTGGERRSAALAEFKPGDTIEVIHSREVLASCPPQTEAYRVTILPKSK